MIFYLLPLRNDTGISTTPEGSQYLLYAELGIQTIATGKCSVYLVLQCHTCGPKLFWPKADISQASSMLTSQCFVMSP